MTIELQCCKTLRFYFFSWCYVNPFTVPHGLKVTGFIQLQWGVMLSCKDQESFVAYYCHRYKTMVL